MQRPAERLGELGVRGRRGGGEVDRPFRALVADEVQQRSDVVVEMDPRDPLLAAGHRAADPELERRQHLGQRAGPGGEHHPGAGQHDPHAELARRAGLGLPLHDHPGEEVIARRRGLVDRRVVAGAVVPGGRLARRAPGAARPSGSARRPATSCSVERTRESRISCLTSALQRCAMVSPSRCTTASAAASAAAGGGAAFGSGHSWISISASSPRTWRPRCASRVRARMVWPSARARATNRWPTSPVAPVTRIFIGVRSYAVLNRIER